MDLQPGVYLYCVVSSTTRLEQGEKGIGDAPTLLLVWQEVALVCSDFTSKQFEINEENVLRHEQVVESLMEITSVLPVRLGTILPSMAEALQFLKTRYDWLSSNLTRLAGKVEYTVRAMTTQADLHKQVNCLLVQQDNFSGKDYLYMKRQLLAPFTALEQTLMQNALAIVKEIAHEGAIVSYAFLVDRAKMEYFEQNCRQIEQKFPDFKFLITGPWPIYSFIEPDNQ